MPSPRYYRVQVVSSTPVVAQASLREIRAQTGAMAARVYVADYGVQDGATLQVDDSLMRRHTRPVYYWVSGGTVHRTRATCPTDAPRRA